jgi:hypothetical protein
MNPPIPGTPDPGRICLKDGFDPNFLYELSYTAKDPLVLGIGFAATRDIISFFRHAGKAAENPVAGAVKHVIGQGISQSGNFVKTFIHLGFNQDEENRIVWDGANNHIAGRQLAMNIRFALPGGAANLYEAAADSVSTFPPGRAIASFQPIPIRRSTPCAHSISRWRIGLSVG